MVFMKLKQKYHVSKELGQQYGFLVRKVTGRIEVSSILWSGTDYSDEVTVTQVVHTKAYHGDVNSHMDSLEVKKLINYAMIIIDFNYYGKKQKLYLE